MFTWDARKRRENLRKHGLDFADAYRIFYGFTVTREDQREPYGELRLSTLGLLNGTVVDVTHTERNETIRIISMRKATNYETQTFFEDLAD